MTSNEPLLKKENYLEVNQETKAPNGTSASSARFFNPKSMGPQSGNEVLENPVTPFGLKFAQGMELQTRQSATYSASATNTPRGDGDVGMDIDF